MELISHTDGRIDASHLSSFVAGYQEVKPLKLGELWAIPIMLRLALIENLRRVAVVLSTARQDRDLANDWADQILEVAERNPSRLIVVVGEMAKSLSSLTRAFATDFLQRMQEKSPPAKLAINWIEERLAEDGLTIAQLVQSESQNQAAIQVSVGNCIGSLRFLDTMNWREFVENQSVVEQMLRGDPAKIYLKMDFATRDLYRHAVERIARFSQKTELEVATIAFELSQKNAGCADDRLAHVGFFLVGKGMKILERAVAMKSSVQSILPRIARKYPLTFYLAGILGIALCVTIPLLQWFRMVGMSGWAFGVLALLTLLCTSQLAVSIVNWFATVFVKPSYLPRMDFTRGVPPAHATLVVVPTMLTSAPGIENLLEALEVRYLANSDQNIYFALLTDFRDSSTEHQTGDDDLLQHASEGIQFLNQKYQRDRPCIFFLFQRPRRWNAQEKIWMGYERKRGKLADLNHSLRGGSLKCFSQIVGDLSVLPHIQYIITLDTDTQLPRDAARQLAATMAHPLNRPVYDSGKGLIVEGYTILQPRVAISLPSAGRSRFVKLFSGDAGIDPYTRTVSDVYQDIFHEGSFIGKGIYDVDAFERTVGGKFPENRILSHDLLEGNYARSGLISDVQLFEEFPSCYSADARRRHRWMRGDWQIATWLLPRLPGPDVRRVDNPLTGLSRWKIFDNLRRSLIPPALIFLLALGWIFFREFENKWGLSILFIIVLPSFLAVLTEFLRKPKDSSWRLHLKITGRTAARQAGQAILTVAFLPYDAVISLDAVTRTLWRLMFTRRHLLEWQTASEVERKSSGRLQSFFVTMWSAPALAVSLSALLLLLDNPISVITFLFLALWMVSPAVAWWISQPLEEKRAELSEDQIGQLRKLARKTWNFFETFVNTKDHWLPPDNFQEYPQAVMATRTSPTNIGMSLLSALAAYDFGYLSMPALMENIKRTLETVEKLERYNGHFYNWYDTRTLKPLPPLYISTVDNGNLAGLLLTLHSGLLELVDQDWDATRVVAGLRDTLGVLKDQSRSPETTAKLDAMEKLLGKIPKSPEEMISVLDKMIEQTERLADAKNEPVNEIEIWRKIFEQNCQEQRAEIIAPASQSHADELENLARRCDELARMDFTLLYDSSRELFSIGYNVNQHRLDSSCYDLLASEARLASYVAIALGQVGQNHWFRLGRSLTSSGGRPTLISWSGSMFEYLMPMLVMPTYENTLLDLSTANPPWRGKLPMAGRFMFHGACRSRATICAMPMQIINISRLACRVWDSNADWLKMSSSLLMRRSWR